MSELKIFNNKEFGSVRTVVIENEPWFVGKDVAEALGYKDTKSALGDHVCTEDKRILKRGQITTFENHLPKSAFPADFVSAEIPNRGLTIINESGLYSLVMSSKLPNAKQFKRWVTSEVLSSIRKHGAYMTPETIEAAILNPDTLIRIATALKEEQEKNKVLQAVNSTLTVKNQIMQPKAEYFDELVDRNLLTNFRDTAKELGIKQKNFVSFLLDYNYIYRGKSGNLMPYSRYIDNGIFEMKECYNDKTSWKGTQTLITPKGRETFRLLCVERKSA